MAREQTEGVHADREQATTGAPDAVEEIAAAWRRERPGTPVESIGVVTRLWQLAKLFGDDRRRLLAEAGVDPATLDLLSVLRRSGPPYTLSTRDLARQSLVTAGAISQRVARAERDGLVTRGAATGKGRTVLVALTAAGHDLVESTVDQVLGRETELLSGLPPHQRGQLSALLATLLHDVQERLGRHDVSHVGLP
ncbi:MULTISPECIES: MarR family winged helix-turn-helix transcriptional regulator [Streptomycetaceae]|nr:MULTISPECIES: MarR family winged helix-turn-helix transcriptional regulator [Streptomycetaceae]MYS62504.1 MarR family transcriptional regulator [Streptomyces sp. SID5468]CCB78427.1 Transcriptional regulator, MarR family [Streptantibioticus cattleyicolor NRRL 8057 = DSM 46488]